MLLTNCQLSIFGNFEILPSPQIITDLMNRLNDTTDEVFMPSIINGQQLDLPTSRVTNLSNLAFISESQRFNIVILNERIDVNYNNTDESKTDIKAVYELACKFHEIVMDYSSLKATRLAMNLDFVKELGPAKEAMLKGKDLIRYPKYYGNKDLVEWNLRMTSQIQIEIENNTDILNVISVLSSAKDITGEKGAVLLHLDINTAPQNQSPRFSKYSLHDFSNHGVSIVREISDDVEGMF